MSFMYADVEREYEKNKDLDRNVVTNLMKWTEDQPHLPNITELQAILFLHSCELNPELAKVTVDKYFTARTLWQDLFHVDLDEPSLKLTVDTTLTMVLPRKAPDGCAIIFTKYVDPNPEHYHLASQYKLTDVSAIMEVHQNGTNNGFYILIDFEGVCLGHMFKFNYSACRRFVYYLQEGAPIKLQGIFLINVPSYTKKFLETIKPLLKGQVLDKLNIYSRNFDEVYKYVPRELFPRDYKGGQELSIAQLLEANKKKLAENVEFFKQHSQQQVDEKKRPKVTETELLVRN